ncbi:MAG TPA: response regulator, partial [Polyangiaceae bacterium]|nr:response regulator [Polyangiaceae bacterium]
MSKGRVLVIDDDEWVCRLLSVAMKEAGFEITITDTAADGFFRAVDEQPHCIVCDVDLPDHDGYWVARRIRQHPSRVSMTPFVFMSGMDDREHRLEGFSVGGDAYLTKPFRIDEVVAQVEALVQMAARLQKSRATLHSIPPSGPAMLGNLAQMNVATVLTMLDLERRSGKLELSRDGEKAEFVLVGGSIASATVGGNEIAALAAIRTVTQWNKGKFAFSPTDTPADASGAEPINALLMEAARLEDEAQNEGGREAPSDRLSSAWKESLRSSRAPRVETPAPPPSSLGVPVTITPGSDGAIPPSSDGQVPVSVGSFESAPSEPTFPAETPAGGSALGALRKETPIPITPSRFNAVRPPPPLAPRLTPTPFPAVTAPTAQPPAAAPAATPQPPAASASLLTPPHAASAAQAPAVSTPLAPPTSASAGGPQLKPTLASMQAVG